MCVVCVHQSKVSIIIVCFQPAENIAIAIYFQNYVTYYMGLIGTCRKSFSWLGQKVNKKIDVYGQDADDSGTDLCPWPRDDTVFQQDISTPISILSEFETTGYWYLNRYLICIHNFEDIRFNIQFE